jgi:hypothetical protein
MCPMGYRPLPAECIGELTHLWCPVPESMQVFCRSSGLRWLGAYENIGASRGLKGQPQWLWLALEPHLFICD